MRHLNNHIFPISEVNLSLTFYNLTLMLSSLVIMFSVLCCNEKTKHCSGVNRGLEGGAGINAMAGICSVRLERIFVYLRFPAGSGASLCEP